MRGRKFAIILLLAATVVLVSCGKEAGGDGSSPYVDGSYDSITAEEAKKMMEEESDCVVLDVRTEDEFREGHIPGAVLIPDYEIETRAEELLTDKEQLILVYCRSGNRSKKASEALVKLGYRNVKEFGGIIDWPYEVAA